MDIGERLPKEVMPPKVPKWQMECIEFFEKISTQWNVGFSGAVGLNYMSVIEIAKIYDFELEPFRFEIIRLIERFHLERIRDGRK